MNVEAVIRRMQNFPAIGLVHFALNKHFERHGVFEFANHLHRHGEGDGSKDYRVLYNDIYEEAIKGP